jgi:hypothetical protein
LLAAGFLSAASPPATEKPATEKPATEKPAAEKPAESGDLRYRRVYFPEGTKEWAKGNEKFLPIEAEEFERLIEAIQRTAPGTPGQGSVGLIDAQYEGRLNGQNLLRGSARLDVSPAIASAMLMTLDPCNLAISRAQWITSDGAPVSLGLSGDGKLRMLAERSGQMRFDWSLAGKHDTAGGTVFTIDLPPSPTSRMRLELPVGLTPVVDPGIVLDAGAADPGFHRWNIELGGRPGCRLRLAPPGGEVVHPQTVLARQSNHYDFSLRGVEVTVQLKLEAHREPLRNVALVLDPSLDLVEVTADDVPLTWNVSAIDGNKPRQASIALPNSRNLAPVHLRMRAIAPLVTASAWKLPDIYMPAAVYRANTIHLAVPAPLCLDHLQTHGCRQSGVGPLAKSPGEQLDFDTFSPDAAIEISLSQRPPEVRAVSATATQLGQGKMSSRVAIDFRTAEGAVFALEADVLPNWTIDSVESQPTDGLDDWTLATLGETRKLSIRLARPLTFARRLRLVVSARRLFATPDRNLGIDDLVPLRFLGTSESRRWVDLRTAGANELRLTAGDHLHRAAMTHLTAGELDLFAEPPGDLLFRDDAGAADVRLSLENRRADYSAAIRVEAVVGDGTLTENYAFACTPSKTAALDRVVIHFVGRREGPLTWQAPGIDEGRFTARRWSARQEAGAGLTADEENWDVTFRNPRLAVMEIRASRKTRLVGPTPVCLASLPDAARQEAMLIVRSFGSQIVDMKTHRLKVQPVEAAPAGQVQTVRGSYQYDPRTEGGPQTEPALVLTAAGNESAAAWVWDCDLRSQFAANGVADHVVSYRIQNTGCRWIQLALPAPLVRRDVHGIWVNKRPSEVSPADPDANTLSVEIPADLKFVQLEVHISTHEEPLGAWNRVKLPVPDIGLPVFARHCRLKLPPGYATCSFTGSSETDSAATFSVSRCLLGFFGRDDSQSTFNPLRGEDWRSLPPNSDSSNLAAHDSLADAAGATEYPVNLAEGELNVIVVRRAAVGAASWLVFLAVVGVGAWRYSGRPLAMLLIAVIFGVPALLLPATISTIFSHGLLGAIFCLLSGLLRRRLAVADELASAARSEMASTLTNILPFGAPLLALVLLYAWNSAEAAEKVQAAQPVASVFIPVDDKQQPIKGKYFLPEPFFDELYHRAALQTEKPQGWMLASAVYHAALTDDTTHAGYFVNRLTAEFGIHVFNAPAHVRIPLRRAEVSLEPGQSKLDERAVQPEWEPDGSALLLDITEPGEDYHLELKLRPIAQPGSGSRLDLAIPRVPTSRLEFAVPAGGPQVEFPAAVGEIRWEEAQSRWAVELGPSDRLSIRWPDDAPAGDAPVVDVEQLLWLKIEPGCVLLDARMKAKAASGTVRRLLVRADKALQLLPSPGSTEVTEVTVQPRGETDTFQTYEIQWPPTLGSSAVFDLHFLWTGVSSLGTVRVPQIDVVNARPVRRLLAVSVDPALEYFMPAGRLQEAGAVLEFLGSWGSSAAPPELAYRLNGNAAEWNLSTRVRRAETFGEQNVTWIFAAQAAEVELDAQLTTATGSVYQYRLEAPAALKIDSVTVFADGVHRAARWWQDADGSTTIFLAAPLSGRHEVRLHGEMPLPMKKMALPQLRLEHVRLQNSLVGLYRRPDVLVEVSGAAGLADVKTPADDAVGSDRGRPLRSFYVDPTAASPVLVTLKPNRPRVSAEQITRIAREDRRWRTTCEFRLQVSEGLLDTIKLDVPASWKDSVTTSPVMAATFAANSDERGTLELSPSAAVSGSFHFTISGPLMPAKGFAAPSITIKRAANVKRFVVLPTSDDQRPVAWELQRLRRFTGKDSAHEPDPAETSRYQVTGDPWQALLLPGRRTTATTRVVKSGVRYAWQSDGRCLGAVFFDVETSGAIDCPLELPEGFELLHVTVDGLPVDAVCGESGTWSLPLTSQAATAHVEMLFFAKSAMSARPFGWTQRYTFLAPKLGGLPVERTLWAIASPANLQLASAEGARFQPSPDFQGELPASDIARDWQRLVAEGRMHVSSATADGQSERVTLGYQPIRSQSWLPRLAGIAGFLTFLGLAAVAVRRGLMWDYFARWPYLFGVGVGLAWWLWLSPSAAGLFIVAAVLTLQFLAGGRKLGVRN